MAKIFDSHRESGAGIKNMGHRSTATGAASCVPQHTRLSQMDTKESGNGQPGSTMQNAVRIGPIDFKCLTDQTHISRIQPEGKKTSL